MSADEQAYVGEELPLFAKAAHWKACLRKQVAGYVGRRVVEVGAGLGAMTRLLRTTSIDWWVCLEPDASQAEEIRRSVRLECWGDAYSVQSCRLQQAELPSPADTILYFDVLEHIEDDHAEIADAATRLAPGGRLIVLSPAHPFLYSPFDMAIGHWRRYSASRVKSLTPTGLSLVQLRHLDSVGMFASLANRFLLRRSVPSLRQVLAWDRLMVPLSGWLDPALGHRIGKSILAVWERRASAS